MSKAVKVGETISNQTFFDELKALRAENRALKAEVQGLKTSLGEAQELTRAISEGDLDALVLPGPEGVLVFTLDSADRAYRTLVETMNEGTATLGFDGTILYCNKRLAELLGAHLHEITGTSIYRFMASEDTAIFKSLLEHKIGSGEVKLQAIGGKSLSVYLSISSLQAEGSPNAWCIVVTDLTEQKKNQELIASERLTRSIIEQSAEIIIVCDTSGRVTHFSKSMLEVFGSIPALKRFEDLIDMQYSDGPDAGKSIFPVSSALKGLSTLREEVIFELRDYRRKFYLLLNSEPLKNYEGEIIGCVMTFTDITERKRTEKELQLAYEELQVQSEDLEAQSEELRIANETLIKSENRFKILSEANALLLSSNDPKTVIQTIAEKVMHHLKCDVFFNYVFDEVQGKLHLNACCGISEEAAKEIEWLDKENGTTVCACVARDGCRMFVHDLLNKKDQRADLVRSMMIQAYACHPLRSSEKTIGTLSFGTKNRKDFTKDELALMKTVADQLSVAIERKKAEEAIKENKTKLRSVLDSSRDLIYRLNLRTGHFEYLSPAIYEIFGYTPQEWTMNDAKTAGRWIHPDYSAVVADGFEQAQKVGNSEIEYRLRKKNGKYIWIHNSVSVVNDSEGKPLYRDGVVREITERKQAEEELRQREEQLRTLVENVPGVLQRFDRKLRVVWLSPAAEKVHGISVEKFIGKTNRDMGMPEHLCELWETSMNEVLETGQPRSVEFDFDSVDGPKTFLLRLAPEFGADGKTEFVLGISTDITELKRTEKALQESKEQLTAFLEQVPVGIGLFDIKGSWLVSNSMLRHFVEGTIPSHDTNNRWRWRSWGADGSILDKSQWPGARALRGEIVTPGIDFLYSCDDGQEIWTRVSAVPFRNDEGEVKGVICTIQNIDSQKRAEEILNRTNEILERKVAERTAELEEAYNSLLENELRLSEAQKIAHIGNWEWNILTDELYWSDELYRIFRLDPLELVRTYDEFFGHIDPEDRNNVRNATQKALNGELYNIEHRINLPVGEQRIVHSQGEVIFNEKGKPVRMRGVTQDITERKMAQEVLERMDKIRIKEIHHRIKNNLQVISSLLDLQAEKFEEEKIKEAFREGQNRVISMSLLHEELYKGEGTDTLDFSAYLEKLAENLFETYNLYSKNIRLSMDLKANAFLDMDTAVPLGIIVNELISNSLKHAFTEKQEGEIRIGLCRDAEMSDEMKKSVFIMSISDDGKGIPRDLELENAESLGLQLVNILVDQLDGEIVTKREQGTEFMIIFNVKKNNEGAEV